VGFKVLMLRMYLLYRRVKGLAYAKNVPLMLSKHVNPQNSLCLLFHYIILTRY
jgi:hypothetical protein